MNRNTLYSIAVCTLSCGLAIAAAEGLLRIKNSSMRNYDIEMWRYARELKVASIDPSLGHDHRRNARATLQLVDIRLNEWGLRGAAVPEVPPERRILLLGGSITLGWGVREEDTLAARLEKMLRAAGENAEVLNGGVGNYNAERYVERFFVELRDLNPTDIVVQYFLRDAEKLDQGGGNVLLRNSELSVTAWIAFTRLMSRFGDQALLDHYKDVYRDDASGFIEMKVRLKALADYARSHNIRLFMAMTPDIHNLEHYQFGFIHDIMKSIAQEYGYSYVDLLPALGALSPEQIWAMPGDPHPNGLGHELMAKAMLPVIAMSALNR
jgi:lysophospholipase L1-like esterase